MARKTKKQKSEVTRIVEYLISGGAFFWSGYLMFALLDVIFDASFFWSKTVSMLFGWTVNFILQRYWVFNNPALARDQASVTGRYLFISVINFVIDYYIVLGLKNLGMTPYIGQFVSAGFFTVWNYLWYKLWVFPATSAKPRKVGSS